MRPQVVRKYRKIISSKDFWKDRVEFLRGEIDWYRQEYELHGDRYALEIVTEYERKLPWYEKKANETNNKRRKFLKLW